jgi:AraC-like DNA-binding protein
LRLGRKPRDAEKHCRDLTAGQAPFETRGMPILALTRIENGRERWNGGATVARHRHGGAYAAVVLAGGYEECGSRGRFAVLPGDVLLHGLYDAHLDRFAARGADILNLVLSPRAFSGVRAGRVADADVIARMAETDVVAAIAELAAQLRALPAATGDWPSLLASDLLRDPQLRLGAWAATHSLAPASVSRGFHKVFGVSPAAFRAEARAQRALTRIASGTRPLAAVAAEMGFADQAHLSRAAKALTGAPPGRWRRSNPFKTTGPRLR